MVRRKALSNKSNDDSLNIAGGKPISRRAAISKLTAVSAGLGVAVVVAGVGGYLAGSQAAPARTVERTVTAPAAERTVTVEKTIEKTVTITGPATITTPPTTITTTPTTIAYPLTPNPTKKWPSLQFWGWEYRADIVRDNARIFTEYTGIPVEFNAAAEPYEKTMVVKFAANEPVDVCYVRSETMGSWAEAGWLAPIDDLPTLDIIKKEYYDYVIDAATYKDRIWGLCYYTDASTLAYNKPIFEKAGITKPPETLEDVMNYAIDIQKNVGVEYPILFPMTTFTNLAIDNFFRLLVADGVVPFTPEYDPVFAESDSSRYILEWLRDAWAKNLLNKTLSGPTKEDEVTAKGFAAISLFTARYLYYNCNITILQGKKDIVAHHMPGKKHTSTTFVRFYCRTKYNLERSKGDKSVEDATWQLLDFYGGKYYKFDWRGTGQPEHGFWVARRWVLEAGLFFAPKSLWEDPKVVETINKYGWPEVFDEASRNAVGDYYWKRAPWYYDFSQYAMPKIQDAIQGIIEVTDVIRDLRDKWLSLKREKMG
jgi:multiple sugar transport system substrate-binding protein